jgi:hypothetical protein
MVHPPPELPLHRISSPVIPKRVVTRFIGMVEPKNIHKAPFPHPLQGRPGLWMKIYVIFVPLGMVYIYRLRGDVEVTHPKERLFRIIVALKERPQPGQPGQLILKVL